jgi:hypothetical protein
VVVDKVLRRAELGKVFALVTCPGSANANQLLRIGWP